MRRYSKATEYEYAPQLRRDLLAEATRATPRRHRTRACHARRGSRKVASASKGPRLARRRRADVPGAGHPDRLPRIAECRRIAAGATFVDGQDHQPAQQGQAERAAPRARGLPAKLGAPGEALLRSEEFIEFAFPVAMAPPLMTRYKPGCNYGAHADAASSSLRMARCAAISAARSSSTSPERL